MKIDRLYAIMIYLLNHGKTSASELAQHFEVSTRTIQRDIDALCFAGIPIAAMTGASGGYELTDTFRMERHTATRDDYAYILTALRGLATATNDQKVSATLEKIASLTKKEDTGIILDFSVLREGDEKILQSLESAVLSKRTVTFTYTNADNETRTHMVEPIAVLYRWYAWYLLAYSTVKNDYRTYKLVRMGDLRITDNAFTCEHECADAILRNADKTDTRTYTDVSIRCKAVAKSRVIEYLNGKIITESENGDALMILNVVENEHFWLGTLLSMGNNIEVLAPTHIRQHVLSAAQNIVNLYDEL